MKIDRRDFLKSTMAVSSLTFLPAGAQAAPMADAFAPKPGKWRRFEVTTRIEILNPQGPVKSWIPLPAFKAADWIQPLGDRWNGNARTLTSRRVGRYGARMLAVEWAEGVAAPVVEVRSQIATRDRSIDLSSPGSPQPLSAAERRLFTAATVLMPTDGIVKETAEKITAGSTDDLAKAQRIYEWIVANTFRDAATRGCGAGDIATMLRTGNLGGKCADLNGLFVGLARAVGIPARDLYGIRVAPSQFGYKSLGANSQTITKAQHCRAEVYLSQYGWVPADPADVRKVMLEEPPGNLPLDNAQVEAARQTLFGAWETNWIAYNDAHDVALAGSSGPAIAFLMYPQAETPAGRLDCIDADAFKYTITAKEIALPA